MVAKPWTPREDAALAARQAAADRTAAAARLADALSAPRASAAPALIVQASQQTDELTARLAAIAPRKADPEVIAANAPRPDQNLPPAPPVMDRPGIDANAAIRLAAAARSRIDAALASGVESIVAASDAIDAAAYAAARRAANGSFRRTRTLRAPAGLAFQQDILSVDQTPAWLLLSRRDPVADDRVAEFRHEPHGDDGSAAFDSDDGDLNSFAARMRGVESAAAVSTDDAVARLEGLLRRLRAA